MKKENAENRYWENEEGETVEFGSHFMRCFEKAGKLQFGNKFYDAKTGEKRYASKFTIDRGELLESPEGLDYLRATLNEWEEKYGK